MSVELYLYLFFIYIGLVVNFKKFYFLGFLYLERMNLNIAFKIELTNHLIKGVFWRVLK